ncbi:MAG: Hint domain-containing protein [Rhodobacteraceae bacterium]|nr:Hint domain-containing protein [Paracoccaceae bacterium]
MPTTYTDQFYLIDPYNPPPAGTVLTPITLNLVDKTSNGTITSTGSTGDSLGGIDITAVYRGDTVTVNHNGTPLTITGTTFYLANGTSYFTPNDGTVLQSDPLISTTYVTSNTSMPVSSLGPPCFTPGTLIRVPGGTVAVEALQAGDLVETLDNGPQVLRWIGRREVAGTGDNAPVRIAAGAFGNDRTLLVSAEHRMMVHGWTYELHFGEEEMLIAAKHLVGMPGISRQPVENVTYLHLLFDNHEIVFAENTPCESLYPSCWMIESDRSLRAEITRLFPELRRGTQGKPIPPARRVVTARESCLIAA